MVFLAEGHLALGRVKAHAFHGSDELVGVGLAIGGLEGGDQRHGRGEAPGGEEVWRGLELLVVHRHQRFVHGVLGDAEVVVRGPFHAREGLVAGHGGKDVAARGHVNAEALGQLLRSQRGVGRRAASPDHHHHLAAGLVLELVDHALDACGEVGGVLRQVFLVHQLGVLDGFLEGLHAVAAKGIVLRQRDDGGARLVHRHGVADGILAAVAAGAEDVFVPLVASDGISRSGLHQQDLFVFLGHGQQRHRHAAGGGADGNVGLVVGIGRGQQALAQVRLALVVFLDHHQLLARHLHRAAGGVLQAHHQANLRLLAVGLQRAGFAVNVGNADLARLGPGRGGNGGECGGSKGGGSDQGAALHGECLLWLCQPPVHSPCQQPTTAHTSTKCLI